VWIPGRRVRPWGSTAAALTSRHSIARDGKHLTEMYYRKISPQKPQKVSLKYYQDASIIA